MGGSFRRWVRMSSRACAEPTSWSFLSCFYSAVSTRVGPPAPILRVDVWGPVVLLLGMRGLIRIEVICVDNSHSLRRR